MPFLDTLLGKYLMTFIVAMIPVLELRGAIPMGIAAGLPPVAACGVAILGNALPAPLVILLARRVGNLLRGTKWFGSKILWLEQHAHTKGRLIKKYRLAGLVLLVGIPLPGTGAWTGALAASFLDIRLKNAMPAILIGLLCAGAITTAVTMGVVHLI